MYMCIYIYMYIYIYKIIDCNVYSVYDRYIIDCNLYSSAKWDLSLYSPIMDCKAYPCCQTHDDLSLENEPPSMQSTLLTIYFQLDILHNFQLQIKLPLAALAQRVTFTKLGFGSENGRFPWIHPTIRAKSTSGSKDFSEFKACAGLYIAGGPIETAPY